MSPREKLEHLYLIEFNNIWWCTFLVSAISTEEAFEKAATEAITKECDCRLLSREVPWSLVQPDAYYLVKEIPSNQTAISVLGFLENAPYKRIKFNKNRLNPLIKRLVARTR